MPCIAIFVAASMVSPSPVVITSVAVATTGRRTLKRSSIVTLNVASKAHSTAGAVVSSIAHGSVAIANREQATAWNTEIRLSLGDLGVASPPQTPFVVATPGPLLRGYTNASDHGA